MKIRTLAATFAIVGAPIVLASPAAAAQADPCPGNHVAVYNQGNNINHHYICGSVKGEKGDAGAAGPKGDTGPIGPRGEAGATGADGAQGPEGPAGDKGETGAQGPAGADSTVPGPIGPQGPAGQTPTVTVRPLDDRPGDEDQCHGAFGHVVRIEMGDQLVSQFPVCDGEDGAAGKDGENGINGLPGANGKDGTSVSSTGARGVQGPAGPRGPAGKTYIVTTNPDGTTSTEEVDSLPRTGGDPMTLWVALAGLGLVVVGTGVTVAYRRRQS